MSHNITIDGGTSLRLKTAGKYCDRDIVVTSTGGGGAEIVLQSKSATPTKSVQEITADSGYTALERVTVAPIPDAYIIPAGTKEITENGTHDVTEYASVSVNVAGSGGDPKALLDAALNNTLTAIDSTVTSVVAYACRGLTKLKTVNIPNTTSVGTYAFYGCTALTSVNAPKVTSLSGYTFRGCSRLTFIDLPELTTCAGNEFYGTAVPTLYLPKLTNCDTYTFSTMKSSKVILPSMKTIAANAFRGASIVTVDLASCTKIEANGFQQCSSFEHLILRADSVCALANTSAFTSTLIAKGTGYVYVPADLVDSYKSATNWSTYAAQILAIEDYPEITGG